MKAIKCHICEKFEEVDFDTQYQQRLITANGKESTTTDLCSKCGGKLDDFLLKLHSESKLTLAKNCGDGND